MCFHRHLLLPHQTLNLWVFLFFICMLSCFHQSTVVDSFVLHRKELLTARKQVLRLHPLPDFSSLTFLQDMYAPFNIPVPSDDQGELPWQIHILERKDLPQASRLARLCFPKPGIVLNSEDMNSFEKQISQLSINITRTYDSLEAYMSNYIGFQARANDRLDTASLRPSDKSTLILAATANPHYNHRNLAKSQESSSTTTTSSYPNTPTGQEIIGLVEFELEEPTGLLTPSFRLLPTKTPYYKLQPYLCNLSVHPSNRRTGLAKYLCIVGEYIMLRYWLKEEIYLHVQKENQAACKLYEQLGYRPIDKLSKNEIIRQNMQSIAYYYKSLKVPDKQNFNVKIVN